jgi:hypothetical protein
MADKTTLEQMLEHLVNDETAKVEELFHEYVVTKSREIYENLIEEEVKDEEVDEASEEKDEDKVDEASKDEDKEEDKVDEASDEEVDESSDDEEVKEDSKDEEVDEEFEEVAVEADDEMDMGGDATDDLESDLEGGDEEGEKEPEELFQDLDSIVDELQAKFDEIKGEEGDDAGEEMGDEEEKEEMFAPESSEEAVAEPKDELETMREYVEKVAGGHGAETKGSAEGADNKKSVVDNMKNDMGGTSANIVAGGEESGKNDGGLADITPKEDNAGNVNVPGAKGATKMSPEKGHGAEKKGAAENADNKQSIFRGRR